MYKLHSFLLCRSFDFYNLVWLPEWIFIFILMTSETSLQLVSLAKAKFDNTYLIFNIQLHQIVVCKLK